MKSLCNQCIVVIGKNSCATQIFRPSLFLSTYKDCQIQRNTAEFSCIATILLCLLQCVGYVAGRNIEAMGSACSGFDVVTGLVTGFQQHSATSGHKVDTNRTRPLLYSIFNWSSRIGGHNPPQNRQDAPD